MKRYYVSPIFFPPHPHQTFFMNFTKSNPLKDTVNVRKDTHAEVRMRKHLCIDRKFGPRKQRFQTLIKKDQ